VARRRGGGLGGGEGEGGRAGGALVEHVLAVQLLQLALLPVRGSAACWRQATARGLAHRAHSEYLSVSSRSSWSRRAAPSSTSRILCCSVLLVFWHFIWPGRASGERPRQPTFAHQFLSERSLLLLQFVERALVQVALVVSLVADLILPELIVPIERDQYRNKEEARKKTLMARYEISSTTGNIS
jgi:hypothetical protein